VSTPWLNRERIRHHALLLALCLWLAYAVDLGTPGLIDRAGHLKGADFLHAYVLGSLANQQRPHALYDAAAQIDLGLKLVPASKDVWFVPIYPPQYSLFFAPLARLPYTWAFVLWSLITAAIYGIGCYFLWKRCPNLHSAAKATVPHVRPIRAAGRDNVGTSPTSTLILLALGFPGFVTLIMFGQNSVIAFAAFTLAYFALRSRRPFLAGLALGLLAYKPQLGIVAAVVFLFTLEWKVIAGAIMSIAAQFAAVVAYFGSGVLRDYWHALTHLSQYASVLEPKLFLMHSLRAFWSMLLPWPFVASALYLLTATIVLVIAVNVWRRLGPAPLSFAVLLVATVLVAPHLTVYDLIIMAPALLFAGDWLLANPTHELATPLRWLLYFSYWTPLLGPVFSLIHFQLSVPIFAAFLLTLASISHESTDSSSLESPASSSASA
jgi:alpha-1,2-mannosyltransferase